MGRAPCCEKVRLKKGRWTAEEDRLLVEYIKANGEGAWRSLPKNAGLLRCGKSCRLRWINYLRDDLKRGNITPEEEDTILKLRETIGNRWSVIATHLPGRTDNEIKNYWNAHLSKKAAAQDGTAEVGAGDPAADCGEVCSEDAGSIVVDAEDVGDCASSHVSPKKRKRNTKGQGSGRAKRSDESHEQEEREGDEGREEKNCDTLGCCRKKKRSRGDKGGCCKDSGSGGRKKNKVVASVVNSEEADKEVVKSERRKKSKNEKPTEKPAAGAQAAASVEEPVPADAVTACPTAHPLKTDSEIDTSGSGGGGVTDLVGVLTAAEEEKGSVVHLEAGGLNSAHETLVQLDGLVNEDCATGLDLLEAIDSDGGLLGLSVDGCLDPHGGMLLDLLDIDGIDGACSWDASASFAGKVDSVSGGWSVSATISTSTTLSGTESINNASRVSTTSSYVNLAGLCDGSSEPAGEAADYGIGLLPNWEVEDDMWRMLSEFVGQVEGAEVTDYQPEQDGGTGQLLQQPLQPEVTPGFLSVAGSCGDDGFEDNAFDNQWFMADMFQI